jgi:hypothetical protein
MKKVSKRESVETTRENLIKVKKVKQIKGLDKEYVEYLVNMLSVLHDMKHDRTLPNRLIEYRGVIEFFSPDKIGLDINF